MRRSWTSRLLLAILPLFLRTVAAASTKIVSTVDELTNAVANSGVLRIMVAPGLYNFSRDMSASGCPRYTALCIHRSLTIEAQQPGTVVLNSAQEDENGQMQTRYAAVGFGDGRWTIGEWDFPFETPWRYTRSSAAPLRRAMFIGAPADSVVELIGLNITGGYVRCMLSMPMLPPSSLVASPPLLASHARLACIATCSPRMLPADLGSRSRRLPRVAPAAPP